MSIRPALSVLTCALAFGGALAFDTAAAAADPGPYGPGGPNGPNGPGSPYGPNGPGGPGGSYGPSGGNDSPSPDDQNDTPLTRYICRLGIGHWAHPLSDAVTEYVWATDFGDADQKARADHPTTPPFEYIAWSRCDSADDGGGGDDGGDSGGN